MDILFMSSIELIVGLTACFSLLCCFFWMTNRIHRVMCDLLAQYPGNDVDDLKDLLRPPLLQGLFEKHQERQLQGFTEKQTTSDSNDIRYCRDESTLIHHGT